MIVGKLSLHEFAYGGTTQNPHHGACRNPWDLARIPGGSSGGAGAALAADFCASALGTDTGGSVRSPAALNGVSALRPTLGRVSSSGVFPITWSFDTVGPMARSVSDLSAVYEVLAGIDPSDPRSVEAHLAARDDPGVVDPFAVRIGLPSNFYFDGIDPEIVDLVRRAATVLEGLGCVTDEVAIPGAAEAEAATRRMISAEALAIHGERLATDPARFGEDVRRRLSSGGAVTGPQYARDVQTGREWRLALSRVFDRFDVLLTPTAGVVAPLVAQTEMIETTRVMTRLTYGWTLAALPVLALPCGLSSGGLPVGLQLIARPWAEQTLFALGAAFQRETRWHTQGRRSTPVRRGRALARAGDGGSSLRRDGGRTASSRPRRVRLRRAACHVAEPCVGGTQHRRQLRGRVGDVVSGRRQSQRGPRGDSRVADRSRLSRPRHRVGLRVRKPRRDLATPGTVRRVRHQGHVVRRRGRSGAQSRRGTGSATPATRPAPTAGAGTRVWLSPASTRSNRSRGRSNPSDKPAGSGRLVGTAATDPAFTHGNSWLRTVGLSTTPTATAMIYRIS